MGGEGPQPVSAQILPLGRARVSASLGHQLDRGQEQRHSLHPAYLVDLSIIRGLIIVIHLIHVLHVLIIF